MEKKEKRLIMAKYLELVTMKELALHIGLQKNVQIWMRANIS